MFQEVSAVLSHQSIEQQVNLRYCSVLYYSTRQFCEQGVECSMDPFEGVECSMGSLSICRLVLAPWVLSVP